jgi:hypothetical protein
MHDISIVQLRKIVFQVLVYRSESRQKHSYFWLTHISISSYNLFTVRSIVIMIVFKYLLLDVSLRLLLVLSIKHLIPSSSFNFVEYFFNINKKRTSFNDVRFLLMYVFEYFCCDALCQYVFVQLTVIEQHLMSEFRINTKTEFISIYMILARVCYRMFMHH